MLAIHPIADRQQLAQVYAAPEIQRARHDHRPVEFVDHPLVSYLGAFDDTQTPPLVGAFLVLESGFVEVDLHCLLTHRARRNARTFGRMCLDHVFANPLIARATAYVFEGLESARNYCLKLGFRLEGFRRDAFQRDGRLIGVYVMGITRREWAA